MLIWRLHFLSKRLNHSRSFECSSSHAVTEETSVDEVRATMLEARYRRHEQVRQKQGKSSVGIANDQGCSGRGFGGFGSFGSFCLPYRANPGRSFRSRSTVSPLKPPSFSESRTSLQPIPVHENLVCLGALSTQYTICLYLPCCRLTRECLARGLLSLSAVSLTVMTTGHTRTTTNCTACEVIRCVHERALFNTGSLHKVHVASEPCLWLR